MKAYKWTTGDMRAFHDGYQFKYGWNEQNGAKDGSVCVPGGFHITQDPDKIWCTNDAKYAPNGIRMYHCYEVFYRKRDVLGQDGVKVRVSMFKILRRKPIRASVLAASQQSRGFFSSSYYLSTFNVTAATSVGGRNVNVDWTTTATV